MSSPQALPPSMSRYVGPRVLDLPEFRRDCTARNISAVDATTVRYCNWASKTHPIVVPVRALRRALDDAVDLIGAYSLTNPEWEAIAVAAALPPPASLHALAGDEDVEQTPALAEAWADAVREGAVATPKPF